MDRGMQFSTELLLMRASYRGLIYPHLIYMAYSYFIFMDHVLQTRPSHWAEGFKN